MRVTNFSWVIPGRLAGCAEPIFLYDTTAVWLSAQGVDALVSHIMPLGDAEAECARNGIEWIYYPIEDFGVTDDIPSYAKLIDRIVTLMKAGKGVCVHCHAGIGRTGMTLACSLGKYLDLSADQAITAVRKARASIESHAQEEFTRHFLQGRAKPCT